MSLFNDNLKKINIVQLLIIIIALYVIVYVLDNFNISIGTGWISLALILYFAYKLKDYSDGFKEDVSNVFSVILFRKIVFIVVLNIFFSYGMLYLTDIIFNTFPNLNLLLGVYDSSMSIFSSLSLFGAFFSTVVLSSISEELVFRGVFLSKLGLIVPTVYAVVISSLIFASLHGVGSITSAFVFGICMAILYLKSNNIVVPILAHFLNNFLAEVIRIVDVDKILFTNMGVVSAVSLFAVISAIILIFLIFKELNNIKY
ncbi:CPBP family intramembrane glutamic endopeptidase [Methanobrevibacter sp.]|uniref:CPBP family intramembrane glutamic endopeptidase n=1 Tax=Methanobrevibacter sp. TaxID=66852 RepID=UPI00388F4A96